jgi:hypothetical protein
MLFAFTTLSKQQRIKAYVYLLNVGNERVIDTNYFTIAISFCSIMCLIK